MLIKASEIQGLLGVSKAGAYRIIQELNNDLQLKGYRTVQGKTSRKFFYENYYLIGMEGFQYVSIQKQANR